jgi:hypothetical protein
MSALINCMGLWRRWRFQFEVLSATLRRTGRPNISNHRRPPTFLYILLKYVSTSRTQYVAPIGSNSSLKS